ncbi:MAG: hypothetical protein KDA24_10060 [Deltaproteobacteria bacterium]|nr:hypothetical protein [Deltaproteobacteria bacterium]
MPLQLVLLQCELQHRHQAPHLAGALFATDLRAAGHEVRCALVHPSAIEEAAQRYGDCDLLLLDSIFPFALQRRLMLHTAAPILVGGHNALQHLLRGPARYALVGPARSTLLAAIEAIENGALDEAPGLWFERDGALHCGPPAPDRRPADEVLPFTPDLDWDYLGPPRASGSNLRIPSVVAELGCVWNRSTLRSEPFYDGVSPRLPDAELSPAAAAALQSQFVAREGGCTFCTFRYQPRRGHRVERAISLVVEQVRVLTSQGALGVSLQTEHPLPLLVPLLDALEVAGLAALLDELHTRTIPWLVLRHREDLEAGIARAAELGIKLVVGQIGFEAFDDASLRVFNKGIHAADNEAAAALLDELHAAHFPHFEGIFGHGLIPLHPWSTPEAVRTNVAVLRRSAPWLLDSMQPFARVELYNEWNPLFWKLEDEGLLIEDAEGFGWGWRYADQRMEELTAASASILVAGGAPATIMDEVARILLEEHDPGARRRQYLALRDELRAEN